MTRGAIDVKADAIPTFGLDARATSCCAPSSCSIQRSAKPACLVPARSETHRPESDIDIALYGDVDDTLAARIAGELDELPLPYLFDVRAYPCVKHAPLLEHIDRVGKVVFTRGAPEPGGGLSRGGALGLERG